ncbi:MAG TPA: hypothetical protein VMF04_04495 [Thermoplasmata archaeon]|nr:hypothetical protein [Thermoplasmata archaeon]
MPTGDPPDPIRATLVAILQQLNRAESINEGQQREQALALADLERMLGKFWAIEQDLVKVPLALGLLVRNGMVEVQATGNYVPPKQGPRNAPKPQYRITAGGKQFLVESLEKSDRIA